MRYSYICIYLTLIFTNIVSAKNLYLQSNENVDIQKESTSNFSKGLKLGMGLINVKIENDWLKYDKLSDNLKPHLGIFGEIKLSTRFYCEASLMYEVMGFQIKNNQDFDVDDWLGYNINVNVDYLVIKLTTCFQPFNNKWRPQFFCGIGMANLISAHEQYSSIYEETQYEWAGTTNMEKFIKKTSFLSFWGTGIRIPSNFFNYPSLLLGIQFSSPMKKDWQGKIGSANQLEFTQFKIQDFTLTLKIPLFK